MNSKTSNLLGIGLRLNLVFDAANSIMPDEIAKAKSRGFSLEFYECDPAKSNDEIVDGLTQYLKSKKYAAISIGNGVQGNKDFTPLFEKLVNACVQHQPETKLAFALLPTTVVDACERVLQ